MQSQQLLNSSIQISTIHNMNSLSPCITSLTTLNLNHHRLKPVSAINLNPSNRKKQQQQPQQQLYQPFRPPPTPLPPKFSDLDIPARIDILANRLGLWYEYAPLITSLIREGFSPPTIEETTGITGVEQNRIIVATQVRDSLVGSNLDEETLSFFDNGGAELLYEIRLLSTSQRASAARFIVEKKCDGKGAQDLARAMKDFPSRRGEKNWENFDYTLPGDCLSFMYYRQSKEHKNPSDQRVSALEQALNVAESDKARNVVLKELSGKSEDEGEVEDVVLKVPVPVVRLKYGEVAEASSVVVLPVCKAEEGEKVILEAPCEMRNEGEFNVVAAEKEWKRWVVLPGWGPLVNLGKGVVVSFVDARVLPWKANRWYKEEPILVVVDRSKRVVENGDGFYLVKVVDDVEGVGLRVQRGLVLKELGVDECLGNVVLVIRPPNESNDDQLSEEDWD